MPASAAPTAAAARPKPEAKGNPGLFPTKSKDPIYITADRLDIYDKEGRAVYSGASGVVVTQGPSKLTGSELTAYYDRQKDGEGGSKGPDLGGSAVKRIVVKGPVSIIQNDQVATGDNADFDRTKNVVTMTGHVSLTQGPNVTTGDKLVYYLDTGIANVFSAPGTPVKSLFVQGSQPGEAKADAKPKPAAEAKTKPAAPAHGRHKRP
jgi:lipopolysaccharide export system protein LptA